jgi:hypothetical protein
VPLFDEDLFDAVLNGFDVGNAAAGNALGETYDLVGHVDDAGEIVSAHRLDRRFHGVLDFGAFEGDDRSIPLPDLINGHTGICSVNC